MSSQKQRGTAFETACVDYISEALESEPGEIHRLTLKGMRDEGDIGGIKSHGKRIVVECKNYSGRDRMAEWLKEADVERGNADALAGVVMSKRKGIGGKRTGEQLVSMTIDDFISILTGIGKDER